MKKEIGGYLNLDLTPSKKIPHLDGVFVNSGRHAIEYLLRSVPHIETLWIPYYTCRVILEPINKLGIKYKRYSINYDFEMENDVVLGKDDYILVSNYFGIKDAYVEQMFQKYGKKLIVDNAHALFMPPIPNCMIAYSPRKMIGVADGGIAFTPFNFNEPALEKDVSFDRSLFLLKRLDLGSAAAYQDSKFCNKAIEGKPLMRMSSLTRALYDATDFPRVRKIRRSNFATLHRALRRLNQIKIPNFSSFSCPLIYPFYYKNNGLKSFLQKKNIFVASYWPYVKEIAARECTELDLVDNLIALPIDQRYGKEEMNYIVEQINEFVVGR